MPKISAKIREILATFVPTGRATLVNHANDPVAIAPYVGADKIHAILRQAESGDPGQLFALYRDIILADSHTQAEFSKRKLALLGDSLSIQAEDIGPNVENPCIKHCEDMIHHTKGWFAALNHLLDSCLWPVSVVEKVYRRSRTPGLEYELAELVPVPATLLDYTTGDMRIRRTDENGNILAESDHIDPDRYIIHRGHLLNTPDWWGGPMRSIIFWWLLGAMDRDWWGRFLERYGSPFLVGKYDQADDTSRSILERAFGLSQKLGGLVISRQTEVEIKQAASSESGDSYEKFLTICQREKSKLILGQTLSAEAQSTGLGSGVANSQEAVRQDIRQFDSMALSHTIRDQLFRQFLRINRIKGDVPRPVWGAESPKDAAATGELLAKLATANLQVSDDSLPTISERLGFTIERTNRANPMPGVLSLSAIAPDLKKVAADAQDANDAISRNATAELSQAWRGAYAPVRNVILSSSSPEEVEQRLQALYADFPTQRLAGLVEEALIAFAANGTIARSN